MHIEMLLCLQMDFAIVIVIITIVLFLGDLIIESQLRMNDSVMTIKYATEYFQVMAFGSVFMILAIFFRSILSGEGEIIFPMIVMGIGTVLNIILDPILIFYYKISGAAFATIISQIIVTIIFIYFLFFQKKSYLNLNLLTKSFI